MSGLPASSLAGVPLDEQPSPGQQPWVVNLTGGSPTPGLADSQGGASEQAAPGVPAKKPIPPAVRHVYAHAMTHGYTTGPVDFATRYAASQTKPGAEPDPAASQKTVSDMATELPPTDDTIDSAIGTLHSALGPLSVDAARDTRQNLLTLWAHTGVHPKQIQGQAQSNPVLEQALTFPHAIENYLSESAEAAGEGLRKLGQALLPPDMGLGSRRASADLESGLWEGLGSGEEIFPEEPHVGGVVDKTKLGDEVGKAAGVVKGVLADGAEQLRNIWGDESGSGPNLLGADDMGGEPMRPPKTVRLYHGGALDHPGAEPHVTSNPDFAREYAKRPGNRLHYLDVPEDHPALAAATRSHPDNHFNFHAPADFGPKFKPLDGT